MQLVFVHLVLLVDKLNLMFQFHLIVESVDLLMLVVMLQVDLVEQNLIVLLVELDGLVAVRLIQWLQMNRERRILRLAR